MFYVSIIITLIAFLGVMYLIGKMYFELNSRIEKIEKQEKNDLIKKGRRTNEVL